MFIINNIKRIIKNNNGAAIVNVILLSSLLAALSTVLVKVGEGQQKVAVYQGQRVKADNFADYLRDTLKSPLACTYTFNALTSGGGTVNDIKDKKDQTIITTNQRWLYMRSAAAQNVDKVAISPTDFEILDYVVAQNISADSTTYEDNDTGNQLQRGTMTLKVTYETSDVARSLLTDDAKSNKTLAGITKFLYIPLNVTIDTSAGNLITNCNLSTSIEPNIATVDKRDFVSVPAVDANTILCSTLNGIDVGDGTCRHLTFNDGPGGLVSNNTNANMYALKTEGSVSVETSLINYDVGHPSNPLKPNDLRVQGSVDIGVHTGFGGPGAYNVPMRDEVTDGELSVAYSVGVGKDGVAPNFTPQPFNLGVPGAFVLKHSMTVGENLDAEQDPQNGKLRVQSNLVLGPNSFLNGNNIYSAIHQNKGNFSASGSLSVGDTSFTGELLNEDGRVNVANHVIVGNPASITGANKNPNNLSGILAGRGIVLGTNADSNVEMRSGDISNYSLVAKDNLYLPNFTKRENYTNGTEGEKYAATMGWVAHKIASTTDPSSVADVISVAGEILNAQPAAQKMFESICKGLYIRNSNGTLTQGVYNSGRCQLRTKHCSEDGECTKVFAGSGGVESQGDIVTTDGNIRATSASNGNAIADQDVIAGGTIRGQQFNTTGNRISLNGCQITQWSDINIGTSSTCEYNVTSCSNNYLAVSIRPLYSTWNYSTGTYVGGVYTDDQQHVSGLVMDCCRLDNYRCNNTTTTPTTPPSCGSSTNTCSSGTFSDRSDTSAENRWNCNNSPHSAIACSTPKGIDGACGSSTNTCDAGVFQDETDISEEGLTFPVWKCLGINSGDDAVCPFGQNTEVGRCQFECSDGSSGNVYAGDSCGGTWETTEQTCITGTMGTVSTAGAGFTWTCFGGNSSSSADDADCEMYTQACRTTANTCNDGPPATIDSTNAAKYLWTCPGGDSCELARENNASCGTTEHTCTASYGSIAASNISDTSTNYVWDCIGESGGTDDTGCTKAKPAGFDCTAPNGNLGDNYEHGDSTPCTGVNSNVCYPGEAVTSCTSEGWKTVIITPRQCATEGMSCEIQ